MFPAQRARPWTAGQALLRLCSVISLALVTLSLPACSKKKETAKSMSLDSPGRTERKTEQQAWAVEKAKKEPFNTEAYDHIADNPFQRVATDPLSTFSIAVDTASYTNMRRFLNEGRLPPRDAVRVHELVNYFDYHYPQPQDEHPIRLSTEVATCPWDGTQQLVRIGLQGRSFSPDNVPPRNLVFLLDTSGSMDAPNRLPLLQQTLSLLVEQLRPQDRVAIVAYAGSAGLVLPSTAGTQKEVILAALGRLHAGGSTNGGAGIELAYRLAVENFIPDGVNRVIIGTDGDFNVGVTSQGDLVRLIEAKRQTGVFLSVLGFGMGNLKDSTMEKLAHHGNGHYAYIDSLEEAQRLFVERGGALHMIATDVKIQVEFNPARVQAYRLIGYESRLLRHQDFDDDTKDAGDMGAGHTITALYALVPPGGKVDVPGVDPLKYQQPLQPTAAADTPELLTVKVRYKLPGTEKSRLLLQPVNDSGRKFDEASEDLRFAAAVAAFGMLLRDSPHKGDATYKNVLPIAQGALGQDEHGRRAEFVRLVETARRLARNQDRP